MSIRVLVGAAIVASLALLSPEAVASDPSCGVGLGAGSTGTVFQAGGTAGDCTDQESAPPASVADGSPAAPQGQWKSAIVCDGIPSVDPQTNEPRGCARPRRCDDGTTMLVVWFETTDNQVLGKHNSCAPDVPGADPAPTADDILRAFRQIPLPESVLVIQPPGGATLVNFETNFYTVAQPFERTVTLLGHQVHFKIRPRSFAWHYGDGSDETTGNPGAAYPALDVTHRYLRKGTVSASVDTVWEADFQIDGGTWAPVNGTVSKTGPPQQLTIKSATPVLVG